MVMSSMNSVLQRLFLGEPSVIPLSPLCVRAASTSVRLDPINMPVQQAAFDVVHWQRDLLHYNLKMTHMDRKFMALSMILQEFLEGHSGFRNHQVIYTDGTESSGGVAAFALRGGASTAMRLYANATVFTAQLHVTLLALQHVERNNLQRSVIYVDLLSFVHTFLSHCS